MTSFLYASMLYFNSRRRIYEKERVYINRTSSSIVILAVIALIATPAVLGIIEGSKKSAVEASARNIANVEKAYYISNLMNNISTSTIDLSKSSFKYDGEQAKKGLLSYDAKGNLTGRMYVSGYYIEITESWYDMQTIC